MTMASLRSIFALLVLFLFVTMFLAGKRFKKDRHSLPWALLAAVFIVAGIFFGGSRLLGYGLLAAGVSWRSAISS